EDAFPLKALQLADQRGRPGIAQPIGEGCRAHRRPVVELDSLRRRMTLESTPLQVDDLLDERRYRPRLRDALGLLERYDIGRRLLDDGEALALQLAQHRGLARARRAGEDVALHSDREISRVTIGHQRNKIRFPQFPQARRPAGPLRAQSTANFW